MKLLLPALINPPRLRKDGSASLSFDTRELSAEEIVTIIGFRNIEGWVCFAPNNDDALDTPADKAEIGTKTSGERLVAVLYVWYKQEVAKGNFVGLFETFRKERMERIIEGVKSKLNE